MEISEIQFVIEISEIQFVILAVSSMICIGSAIGIMCLLRELPEKGRDSDAEDL
jgi:hypothetical protein